MTQEHDLSRYHRQTLLPGFGEAGQRKLLASKALIVGCGALGTVIANMLARAGVGHLVIVDRDYIEMTNLQRQVLFDETDVAESIPKAEAAKRKIAKINSQVTVTAVVDDVNHTNIEKLAAGCDVIVDGVDNFETRFLTNDCAVKLGIPYIYGGAVGTVGMCYAILPHTPPAPGSTPGSASDPGDSSPGVAPGTLAASGTTLGAGTTLGVVGGQTPWERAGKATPCLKCIFEQAPPPGMNPTCDTAGVLGPVVSIVANYQVAETLKVLTGNWDAVSPTLLSIDIWSNTIKQFKVARAYDVGECVCCKKRQFEFLEGKFAAATTTLCGRNAVQLTQNLAPGQKLNFEEIAQRLQAHGKVSANKFMLRADISDNGDAYELTLFTDGRAIVKGTKHANVAKSVYAKYVGA